MNWEMLKTLAAEIGVPAVGVGSVLIIMVQIQTVRKLLGELKELRHKQKEALCAFVQPTPTEIARYLEEARRIVEVVRSKREQQKKNSRFMHYFLPPPEPRLPNGRRVAFRRRSVVWNSFMAASCLAILFFMSLEMVRFPAFIVIMLLVIAIVAVLLTSFTVFLGISRDEHLLALWLISQRIKEKNGV